MKTRKTLKLNKIVDTYLSAKFEVLEAGYGREVSWQESITLDVIDEEAFLEEAAWVVLSSGISYRAVSNVFLEITEAFFGWDLSQILENRELCFQNAYSHFRNDKKIRAIIIIAEFIQDYGFNNIIDSVKRGDISALYQLPFMGQATTMHLLKNLGMSIAKPDRHLKRITYKMGYESPMDMCNDISMITGDQINVVDIVLWRFATLKKSYLDHFAI